LPTFDNIPHNDEDDKLAQGAAVGDI